MLRNNLREVRCLVRLICVGVKRDREQKKGNELRAAGGEYTCRRRRLRGREDGVGDVIEGTRRGQITANTCNAVSVFVK